MKPLSFRFVAIAAAWLILCSAFSSGKHTFPAQTSAVKDNTHYYYYLAEDDSFDAYNTLADEIARQEGITGGYVNTNPLGGSLLVSGYINNQLPHGIWPSSYLYVHY